VAAHDSEPSTALSARSIRVGRPAGGVPRPRGATPATPRSWPPSAVPAVPAIPAAGRRSVTGVEARSTDHV